MECNELFVAEPTLINDVPEKPKLFKVYIKKFERQEDPRALQHWEREAEALRHVGTHANIVQITHSDAVSLTITLRWAPGYSLDHFIKSDTKRCTLTHDDARLLWKQMSSALAYIHSKSTIHDDVKPHNIVWNEQLKYAVLIDFGAALVNPESLPEGGWTPSGTPPYAPPEFFEKKKCQAGDMWALGVTMLFAFGDIPLPDGSWILPHVFENEDAKDEMMQWLLRIESKGKSLDHAGDGSLLAQMLHWNPGPRISSDDLVRHLEA
ncbi:Serine/threonine-protein kinase ppk34 [Colletotrichum aenigma]|uniref:Serine/threonine-protein kinase ppk34 n=1 Tax=Colletotrichum aenigma TaxID=1215731 RepID=UPI0018730584|nr:Serine/threonine-protein kinase ppk34 [Colletotrichum aenigma]KAF5518712.1 Serine/threonine-protein kinase ppk34 [Colletotrichum aenigma]